MFKDNSVFREALLQHFGVRECFIKLKKFDVADHKPKLKLLSKANGKSVRGHVKWLPLTAQTVPNSAPAISAFYRYQKSVVKTATKMAAPTDNSFESKKKFY